MKRTLIALTILACALSGARAGLFLSDDFNYNDGPIAQPTADGINPDSTWLSNSGTTPMDVTNDTLIVTTSRSEDMVHLLNGEPYLTNDVRTTYLYSRFTLKCTYLPTASGTYFAGFGGTNAFAAGGANVSGYRARIFASLTNYLDGSGVGVGQFRLGIVNSGYGAANNSLGSTNFVWPTPLNTNQTYTINTRYNLATGASTLWVDATAEADSSVTDTNILPVEPTTGAPTNGVLNICAYCFRQASGEGDQWIDNLRIAPTWADLDAPSIQPTPPTQNIPMGGTTPTLSFQVSSPIGHTSTLQLTKDSTNLTLVPTANIVLTQDSGGNCTVTVTGAPGQQGQSAITITVTDPATTANSSMSFLVIVGAPTVGAIPNQITSLNTPTPAVPFAVSDAEGDALTITKASSNTGLVPLGNIAIGVAGPGSSNVVVTPATGQSGVSYITISASDGHNTTSSSFAVTVTPAPLGVVYKEDFAYIHFVVPDSLYLATGGSGGPWNNVSGPLGEIQVTNGWAYLVYTNNEDLGANFIGPAQYIGSQGYVFYTSFTANWSYPPSNLGDYFFHLGTNGTDTANFRDKVFANTAGAAAGSFRLGIANSASTLVAQNSRDLTTNATYAIVTRYNAATGDSTLWVNPVNAQSASVTASDNQGSSIIGGVALRQPGCCIGSLAIGPMKVGTAFSDVFTAPARPTLNIALSAGNVVLTWTDPSGLFVLQQASNVAGPYTDMPGVASGYSTPIAGPQYFRLRY